MTEADLAEVVALMARRNRALMLKNRVMQCALEGRLVTYGVKVDKPVDWTKSPAA